MGQCIAFCYDARRRKLLYDTVADHCGNEVSEAVTTPRYPGSPCMSSSICSATGRPVSSEETLGALPGLQVGFRAFMLFQPASKLREGFYVQVRSSWILVLSSQFSLRVINTKAQSIHRQVTPLPLQPYSFTSEQTKYVPACF